jgi:cell filamentation protein
MKYKSPDSEDELLPNLLGLITQEEIGLSEFEGFLKAEIMLTESLSSRTKFNVKYILNIHKLSLEHLYAFAGKYRDVNLSKGGFPFAAAKFLPQTMSSFEDEILSGLPNKYASEDDLIKDIAVVHGELLFIHPFREGNGRTARVLANLMSRKAGYGSLQFDKVGKNEFEMYVQAVQKSADKDYNKMIEFIRFIFPG